MIATRTVSWLAVLGLAGVSCGEPPASVGAEPPTLTQSPLVGTVLAQDTVGLPQFSGGQGSFCSAVQISDYWTLTARHCLISPYLRGDSIKTTTSSGGVVVPWQTIPVARGHQHPVSDAALLRLSARGRGSSGVFKNGFYRGTTASLMGQALTCYGWGPNTSGGPVGTLRSATVTVDHIYPWSALHGHRFRTTGTIYGGDSGGPCFVNSGGAMQIVGVTASSNSHASVESFRDWADALMTGDLAPDEAIVTQHDLWNGYSSALNSLSTYSTAAAAFVLDNDVTAARVGTMATLHLYLTTLFTHPTIGLTAGDWPNLTAQTWNDHASAFYVAASASTGCSAPTADQVVVYDDINYQGACDVLEGGLFDSLSSLNVGATSGISSIKVGSNARVTVYNQVGFEGSFVPQSFTSDQPNLTTVPPNWNDAIRSLRINGRNCLAPGPDEVVLWSDSKYRGSCAAFSTLSAAGTPIVRTFTTPAAMALADNSVSSIQVGTNARAALYENTNLGGAATFLRVDHPFLAAVAFNDRASSLKLEPQTGCPLPGIKQVVLYEHSNFTGKCEVLGLGNYDTPLNSDFEIGNDFVSSIRVGPSTSVTLFQDDFFQSSSVTFTTDQASLPGWNDSASSILVQ